MYRYMQAELAASHDLRGHGGDVTLNIFGGTILDAAYGGSDVLGNIEGEVQVNVYNIGGSCNLDLNNLYGAGRNTAYTPQYTPSSGTERISPIVNLINGTVKGNVYGGGQGATATSTASPKVNIGYDASMGNLTDGLIKLLNETVDAHYHTLTPISLDFTAYVKNDVYGGGNAAPVVGSTSVNLTKSNTVVDGYVYGGGRGATAIIAKNTAGDYGNTNLSITDGWVKCDAFGGGDAGNVENDVTVTMSGGRLGGSYSESYNPGDLFGGARNATIGGDVILNLNGGRIKWDVYGGNDVYSDHSNILGKITVNVLQTGSNVIRFDKGGNIFGAGRNAVYTPADNTISSPEVNIIHYEPMAGATITNVYGGGYGTTATVTANPVVNFGYDPTTIPSSLISGLNPEDFTAVANKVCGGGEQALL